MKDGVRISIEPETTKKNSQIVHIKTEDSPALSKGRRGEDGL
jgi:hypothetical protein